MNKLTRNILNIVIPFVVILGLTFLTCYLYLFKNLVGGDDVRFHLGNIVDVYHGLINGHSIDSTNHLLMGSYAYNTHLFYAPLPHYFAAISMVIFKFNVMNAVKFTAFFFTFIGTLFAYFFALKVSGSRRMVALFGAAFFILCPYRMFCGFCRFAFAEAIAMTFIPVLFYGIYALTHDKQVNVRSFLAIIFGVSGLVLSHPFTALISCIFALVYMAIKYKAIYESIIKNRKGLILTGITVLAIFGMISFYFFPMMVATRSGLYRISDETAMWTNYQHLADSIKNSWNFSGFLNLNWIGDRIEAGKWPDTNTQTYMLVGCFIVIISAILVAINDHFVQKLPKSIYYRYVTDVIVSIIPLLFVVQRLEVYLGVIAFDIVFIASSVLDEKNEPNKEKTQFIKIEKELFKDLIYLFVSTLIVLIFIFVRDVWYKAPKILYTAQFAWRLWSIVSLFATWIFVIAINALSKCKNKIAYVSLGVLPFFMFVASQSYPEKRVALKYEPAQAIKYENFDEEEAKHTSKIGVMNEYIPVIYYDNEYTSQYENSLYTPIKKTIGNYKKYSFDKDTYMTPAFLTNSGSIEITYLNTPAVWFTASVDADNTLIQIPQFYYDGYKIDIYEKGTDTLVSTQKATNVDSLVCFTINQGEYDIKVNYKGPTIRNVMKVYFYANLPAVAFLCFLAGREFYLDKKKEFADQTSSI